MILYEDHARVCIATFNSSNRKTGNMVQLWILPSLMKPSTAVKTGADRIVCGDCKHRNTSCYVNVGQAPDAVWKTYKRGGYEWGRPHQLMAEDVRFGAYGDPAYLPTDLIQQIVKYANSWTGYTHQWEKCDQQLKDYFMASVDTPEEYQKAKSMGWKTFRTIMSNDQLFLNETMCPYPVVTCKQCKKCDTHTTSDIAVEVHGTPAKIKAYKSLRGIDVTVKTA
jgi:hypothetical protein